MGVDLHISLKWQGKISQSPFLPFLATLAALRAFLKAQQLAGAESSGHSRSDEGLGSAKSYHGQILETLASLPTWIKFFIKVN